MRPHGRNGKATKPPLVAESDKYIREKENKMYLTFNDYVLLVGYVSVAAFASYATHEVAGAIRSYLDG